MVPGTLSAVSGGSGIGSSSTSAIRALVYATAQDFARFGLLYLRDGVWEGTRILPEGWVDFARTPAPGSDANIYGAGFWVAPADGQPRPPYGSAILGPRDSFQAQGFEGLRRPPRRLASREMPLPQFMHAGSSVLNGPQNGLAQQEMPHG